MDKPWKTNWRSFHSHQRAKGKSTNKQAPWLTHMWPMALAIFAHEVGNAKGVGYKWHSTLGFQNFLFLWGITCLPFKRSSMANLYGRVQGQVSLSPEILEKGFVWGDKTELCPEGRQDEVTENGEEHANTSISSAPLTSGWEWARLPLEQCTISRSPYFCPFILTSYLFKSHLHSDFQAHFHFCHEFRSWMICLTCSL